MSLEHELSSAPPLFRRTASRWEPSSPRRTRSQSYRSAIVPVTGSASAKLSRPLDRAAHRMLRTSPARDDVDCNCQTCRSEAMVRTPRKQFYPAVRRDCGHRLQVIRPEEAGVLYSLVFGEGVMNDATSVAILRAVQARRRQPAVARCCSCGIRLAIRGQAACARMGFCGATAPGADTRIP